MVVLKSPQEIEKIRKSNEIVSEILQILESEIQPKVNTLYLNDLSEKLAREKNAIPAFKGYRDFPYSLCASVNNVVVHGFPNKVPLQEGDIVSLDFGILFDGYYGDAAKTVAVGKILESTRRLTQVTEESLYKGIEKAVPDGRLSDISHAIQSYAEAEGFSVVRQFVGHGIGGKLHEDPQIPNFGKPGMGIRLKSGMTLAIEPMVNEKGHDVEVLEDGWTAVTKDGCLSAHFEHTIAITDEGPVILSNLYRS
ncbi:MAG: type I methionyl aminopeptidase [Desulfobacterales bacterium]|jgi:methionyl aminopeptidase|nr:type I methionyl aminopeptidase [Desulfobacter sp.]MDP6394298.1 type I methionyl aminopeptidase [Desulfobacterales bacterium]MDP6682325.1 type I methionyl aminopeptidase [Desulfobacterales bacterium]MDP6807627.1 type I methionyl aminopeptidase [Desulfobacterales bacterium]|tara:strand:+ start:10770 stop:11525 length:756 start_codon:yes stop_codon:yes gene_type:complete